MEEMKWEVNIKCFQQEITDCFVALLFYTHQYKAGLLKNKQQENKR